MGSALDKEVGLLMGKVIRGPDWSLDGPDILLHEREAVEQRAQELSWDEQAVDICLSGPEEGSSGPTSPVPQPVVWGQENPPIWPRHHHGARHSGWRGRRYGGRRQLPSCSRLPHRSQRREVVVHATDREQWRSMTSSTSSRSHSSRRSWLHQPCTEHDQERALTRSSFQSGA